MVWRSLYRVSILTVWLCLVTLGHAAERFTGPWDMDVLTKPPAATWGKTEGLAQEVYYEGEKIDGKPTQVFAYYAKPAGEGPFPAMVLVHGGTGAAFAQWATLWAKRGYVALAMDLAGCGPGGARLKDGGPALSNSVIFRKFTDNNVTSCWTYHAVAAVVRGHSLLAGRKEVDRDRIGITGVSWGGYLTCIAAGIDDRLKVAVPVYGCGFLKENSCWLNDFAVLGKEQANLWAKYFDPSRYLPGVMCPILFINGTNDFAYPLDSYQRSYQLVRGPRTLRIEVGMGHGYAQGWAPKEIGLFVDSVLKGGDPLPSLGAMETASGRASAKFTARLPVVSGQLHYTTDSGAWQKRNWQSSEARLAANTVSANLPTGRPLVYYLSVTDDRGAMVSTEHCEER